MWLLFAAGSLTAVFLPGRWMILAGIAALSVHSFVFDTDRWTRIRIAAGWLSWVLFGIVGGFLHNRVEASEWALAKDMTWLWLFFLALLTVSMGAGLFALSRILPKGKGARSLMRRLSNSEGQILHRPKMPGGVPREPKEDWELVDFVLGEEVSKEHFHRGGKRQNLDE